MYTRNIIPNCLKLTPIEEQQIIDWANSIKGPTSDWLDAWLEEDCVVGGLFVFEVVQGGLGYEVSVHPEWDRDEKFRPYDDTVEF